MELTRRQRENKQRVERLRGWIINILHAARPDPKETAVLSDVLDSYGFGCSRRALAAELEYLRSLKMLRVFPLGDGDNELTSVQQAKLLQRYANSDSDQELSTPVCATITAHGINFQEGLEQIEGVQRVR